MGYSIWGGGRSGGFSSSCKGSPQDRPQAPKSPAQYPPELPKTLPRGPKGASKMLPASPREPSPQGHVGEGGRWSSCVVTLSRRRGEDALAEMLEWVVGPPARSFRSFDARGARSELGPDRHLNFHHIHHRRRHHQSSSSPSSSPLRNMCRSRWRERGLSLAGCARCPAEFGWVRRLAE